MLGDTPLVFQDWADGVFAFHPASTWCSFGKSPLGQAAPSTELCVSLEVEAEGRVGVPVVERVGLVASGVQFITRLAAVFTEEFGYFFMVIFIRII